MSKYNFEILGNFFSIFSSLFDDTEEDKLRKLSDAIIKQNINLALKLLPNISDINSINGYSVSPLTLCIADLPEIGVKLLQLGADPNVRAAFKVEHVTVQDTAFHHSLKAERFGYIRIFLLFNGDYKVLRDEFGNTGLDIASQSLVRPNLNTKLITDIVLEMNEIRRTITSASKAFEQGKHELAYETFATGCSLFLGQCEIERNRQPDFERKIAEHSPENIVFAGYYLERAIECLEKMQACAANVKVINLDQYNSLYEKLSNVAPLLNNPALISKLDGLKLNKIDTEYSF